MHRNVKYGVKHVQCDDNELIGLMRQVTNLCCVYCNQLGTSWLFQTFICFSRRSKLHCFSANALKIRGCYLNYQLLKSCSLEVSSSGE